VVREGKRDRLKRKIQSGEATKTLGGGASPLDQGLKNSGGGGDPKKMGHGTLSAAKRPFANRRRFNHKAQGMHPRIQKRILGERINDEDTEKARRRCADRQKKSRFMRWGGSAQKRG